MTASLHHRGPDDEGIWLDKRVGVALGHKRLAVLDLSPAGHQPMISASGRYIIVFNGEIYNHLELRKQFNRLAVDTYRRNSWRGYSDTETLLAGFELLGVKETIRNTVGMFALAVWDTNSLTLTLARDRFGEKPLYYGWQGSVFLFGSELKALRRHTAFRSEINRDALALYLRHNYISAPYSIYRDIHKLLPGTYLEIHLGQYKAKPMTYWSAREQAELGQRQPYTGTEEQAISELEELIRQSLLGQIVADVPLGAFLSGGVDSSTVVSLMQELSSRPVKTFTIGFHEARYNEAKHAKAVAQHLGTEHTELYVTPAKAMEIIPKLPSLYDEPFSDSSQIPTFLVAQLTRHYVTVALSGDGGDELFGGYNRYFWARSIWRGIKWLPQAMRCKLARTISSLPPDSWNYIFSKVSGFLPLRFRITQPGDKAHRLAEILTVEDSEALYLGLVSQWKSPTDVVIGSNEPTTALTAGCGTVNLKEFEQRMMYLDAISYLPDDILVKIDRAAMGISLETRVPFLDHRIAEFAWRLPLSLKVRNGQGKWILRQVLHKYVPRNLIERPKMGFGVPIDIWLRGPLREWAETLLDESRLRREGFFHPEPIRQKWREHLSGNSNWQYYLWNILMFQAWLLEQG